MELNWRTQRQIIIFSIYFLIVFIPVSIVVFSLLRKSPSCYDRIQNQDESGVDCGGSVCSLRCDGTYRDIRINFVRALKVSENKYDVFALMDNFNTNIYFPNVPYDMSFYSVEGKLMGSASGSISVLPQRRAVVYFPNLNLAQEPKTVDFAFGEHKAMSFPAEQNVPQNVNVESWQAQRGANESLQVVGEIKNPNTREVRNLSVYAMLYDGTKTVYAVSKTVVDVLPGREKTAISFSWGNIGTPENVDFVVIYE